MTASVFICNASVSQLESKKGYGFGFEPRLHEIVDGCERVLYSVFFEYGNRIIVDRPKPGE